MQVCCTLQTMRVRIDLALACMAMTLFIVLRCRFSLRSSDTAQNQPRVTSANVKYSFFSN
jgi:hypothetical protein